MSGHLPAKPGLPDWAESVRRKYVGGEASVFLLHGNVFDEVLDGEQWRPLEDFIVTTLLGENKAHVAVYDPSDGISVRRTRAGSSAFAPAEGAKELEVLESALLTQDGVAVVVKYADSVAPAGDEAVLAPGDRLAAVRLHRWSLSNAIATKDNVVFLIAESLTAVNAKLVSNPRVATVEIPMPSQAERERAIRKVDPSIPEAQVSRLGAQTSGLRSVHIRQILAPKPSPGLDEEARRKIILAAIGESADAGERADKLVPLTAGRSAAEIEALITLARPQKPDAQSDPYAEVLALVARRKREIIERECTGLIEFLDGGAGLEAFGGNDTIKAELHRVAADLRAGDLASAPMGMMVVGAMGTGKTFLVRCFANTSGITAVVLKNFRDKWVGSTEGNLEKVLAMVRAMGPILVVIDEGDRALGGESGESDGGTSSRVMARIKEFASDTSNRGQVIFVVMTNRPDRLDTDMKRAGRFGDIKIPLFYPQTAAEVNLVLQALARRHKIRIEVPEAEVLAACGSLQGYSNADIEAVLLLARKLGSGVATKASLDAATTDYLTSRDTAMIDYMNLLAVFEASRRSWLPTRFKDLTPEQLTDQLADARRRCGPRATG